MFLLSLSLSLSLSLFSLFPSLSLSLPLFASFSFSLLSLTFFQSLFLSFCLFINLPHYLSLPPSHSISQTHSVSHESFRCFAIKTHSLYTSSLSKLSSFFNFKMHRLSSVNDQNWSFFIQIVLLMSFSIHPL